MNKDSAFDSVLNGLCSEKPTDKIGDILEKSLFYYCAGKDPTPIIAMYRDFPLFIYSDIMKYGRGSLEEELSVLTDRLVSHGFEALRRESIDIPLAARLCEYKKDERAFLLLYVKGDSLEAYRAIYGTEDRLLPTCIANYRYEMDTRYFLKIEKRVKYVLGHSYDKEHRPVRELKYYGDYSGKTVTLFEKENLTNDYD